MIATEYEPAFDGGYLDIIPDGAMPLVHYAAAAWEPDDSIEARLIAAGKPARSEWTTAARLAEAFPDLRRENDRGWNVYVGANPRPQGKRGDAAVTLARCVWADFDGIDPEIVLASIRAAGMPIPTLLISSGHGTHAYWRLMEPTTDLAAWSAMQRDLAALLASDPAVSNPERVMRLPGFANRKSEPVPCCIVSCEATHRVSWGDLRRIVPRRPQEPAPVRRVVVVDRADLTHGYRRARAYIARMPVAVAGQHGHDACYAVACECVRFGLGEAEAMDLLTEYSGRCDPPWNERELAHKLADARRKAVAGERLIGGRR